MPIVTIIVPIYNCEKYIKQCIDSILAQDFHDFEVLLIDDGSTDKSGLIADEYILVDNRIKVFHKENAGLSHTRNYGIQLANGKYLAFFDCDDVVHPKFLSIMVDACESNQLDIAQCNLTRFVDKIEFCEVKNLDINVTKFSDYFQSEKPSCYSDSVCNKLFRKSLFDDIKFSVGELFEDGKIMANLWLKSEFQANCNFDGYLYRVTPNSIITKYNFDKDYEQIIVWEKRAEIYKNLRYDSHVEDMNYRILSMLMQLYAKAKYNKQSKEKKNFLIGNIKKYIILTKHNRFITTKHRLLINIFRISPRLWLSCNVMINGKGGIKKCKN